MGNKIYNLAREYVRSNLSVIPVDLKKSKLPYTKLLPKNEEGRRVWGVFQEEIPTPELLKNWFEKKHPNIGLALIMGPISDNAEAIDFDNPLGNVDTIFKQWSDTVKSYSPSLFNKLVIQKTPSGGYHVIYRCEEIERNQKIAKQEGMDGKPKAVIETRGEGGYILADPTKNYKVIQNDFTEIKLISIEERETLFSAAKEFNTVNFEEHEVPYKKATTDRKRPGDDFNERGEITAILKSKGWNLMHKAGEKEYWRRPGKRSGGWSATFNHKGNQKFYVFSSNAHPFQEGNSYDKFAVFTILEHNGNFSDAAKALHTLGYGEESESEFEGYEAGSQSYIDENGQIQTKTKKKKKKNKQEKIEEYILKNYKVRKNLVSGKFEIKKKGDKEFREPDDSIFNQIKVNLSKLVNQGLGSPLVKAYLTAEDHVYEYDPFKDYFENLPEWDREDHIEQTVSLLNPKGNEDGEITLMFTKWLVSTVVCALNEDHNHVVFILLGPQGIGKTTFFRNLIPPALKDYYCDNPIDPKNKDDLIKLSENMLIALDEIDEITTKKEAGALKNFITHPPANKLRRPYDQFPRKLTRRASFCGAVNKAKFLNDLTGARRYLIAEVEDIDYKKKINHEQLYAQALYLLRNGFKYWFEQDEIKYINKRNENYEKSYAEVELVDRFLEPVEIDYKGDVLYQCKKAVTTDNKVKFWKAQTIADYLKSQLKNQIYFDTNRMAEALKRRGFFYSGNLKKRKVMRMPGEEPAKGYLIRLVDDKENKPFEEDKFF